MMKKVLSIVSTLLLGHICFSQVGVSMQELLDSALNRNADLQKIELEIERAETMNRVYNGIGKTNLTYTYGQIDGPEQDYQWQVNQTLGNPVSGAVNNKVRQARISSFEIEYKLNKAWVRMQVEKAYAGWQAWHQIKEINQALRETYQQALKVAERQSSIGELGKTEVGFAKGRYAEAIKLENQAYQESLRYVYQLELLSRVDLTDLNPEALDFSASPTQESTDSLSLMDKYYLSRVALAEKNRELSGSRFVPSFSVGYFNQQLNGIEGFDGFTVGAKIPLFDVSTYQNRQLASIDLAQSEVEANQGLWQRQSRIQQLSQQRDKLLSQLVELSIDPKETAAQLQIIRKNYELGEIDMLVFSQFLSALSSAEISQAQMILSLHQIQAELNYLITEE